MSLPVFVRPGAAGDVADIVAGYDRQSQGVGAAFAARFAATIDAIARFPALFGEVGHGVRAAPIPRHPHVVYYHVLADRVEVFAILHGARDQSVWQGRA